MKKLFPALVIAITACFAVAGCGHPHENLPNENGNGAVISPGLPEEGGETVNPDDGGSLVQEKITKMYITVNGNKLEVALAENSAADALAEILKQGDITYTAEDYGGFEKVGSLGHSLPASNSQITAQPGDVMLYLGDKIVLFYGNNSWSYTRLGKINGYSVSELKTLLGGGKGSVQITLSLK